MTIPPPVPRPCEKCGAEIINDSFANVCRLCGRRWHPECSAGVKLCPRCTRPLQSAAASHAVAERRIASRNQTLKAAAAAAIGGGVVAVAATARAFYLAAEAPDKPWLFSAGGLTGLLLTGAACSFLWLHFFRKSKKPGEACLAAAAGVVLALLIMTGGFWDLKPVKGRHATADDSENNESRLLYLSAGLFVSAAGAVLRWDKLPKR